MGLVEETKALRAMLSQWANEPELLHLSRYDLLKDKPAKSLVSRWYRTARKILFSFGIAPPYITQYPWLATLKHSHYDYEPQKTILIWALNLEKEDLHIYCEGFQKRFRDASAIVPVLVTNVPDFHYFSRLKWLVEYAPEIEGGGCSYSERKQRYLAWRYRDALVVPASAGIAEDAEWNELMELQC